MPPLFTYIPSGDPVTSALAGLDTIVPMSRVTFDVMLYAVPKLNPIIYADVWSRRNNFVPLLLNLIPLSN